MSPLSGAQILQRTLGDVESEIERWATLSDHTLRPLCSTALVISIQSLPSSQACTVLRFNPTLHPAALTSFMGQCWKPRPQTGDRQGTGRQKEGKLHSLQSSATIIPCNILSLKNTIWDQPGGPLTTGAPKVTFLTCSLGHTNSPPALALQNGLTQ